MTSTNHQSTRLKKLKQDTVSVQLLSCWNADNPSLSQPLDLSVAIKKNKWKAAVRHLGYETLDSPAPPPLYWQLEEAFFSRHIADLGGVQIGKPPWNCRGCGQVSAVKINHPPACFHTHVQDKDAAERSTHVLSLQYSIVVPVCETPECLQVGNKICHDYNRKHMKIDSCNSGIDDFSNYFTRYASHPLHDLFFDVGETQGAKPLMVFSMHINADRPAAGKIVKVPFFRVPSCAQAMGVRPFTVDSWPSLSDHDKNHAIHCLEASAHQIILAQTCFDKKPLSCRECGKSSPPSLQVLAGTSMAFAFRGREVHCIPHESIFVSRPIAIPICTLALHSPCRLRAEQRAEHWNRCRAGDTENNRSLRRCSLCGTAETPAHRFEQCSKCKACYYCSKEHQLLHWRHGHKLACRDWKYSTNCP